MIQKTRLEYIDIFKGVGIVIMIMGHVGFGPIFDHFIHGFHMPIFFFISGFLFISSLPKKNAIFKFIKRKAYRLLLPYCIWGLISYFIWVVRWGNRSWVPLLHLLFENTTELPIAGALWFLTALFFVEIVYFLIDCFIKNMKIKTIIVCMLALAGNFATSLFTFRLPYAIDTAFVGIGLFHAGYMTKLYLYKGEIQNIKKCNIFLCIGTGIVIGILIFKNGIVNMRMGMYANIVLFWINSIGASLVGINVTYRISKCKIRVVQFVLRILKRIGCDSMVYLCLNQLVLTEVWNTVYLLDRRVESIRIEGRLFSIVVFLLTMIFLYIADIMICGTKFKVCVGK